MKKKFLTAAFAVAIMAVAGFNVYMNQAKSDFLMENVSQDIVRQI